MIIQSVDLPAAAASGGPNLILWISILVGMALLPFLLTMVTSFAKLVIVGGILRQALGTPQIPPTLVITGLAMILTVHIMSPVVLVGYRDYQSTLAQMAATRPISRPVEDKVGEQERIELALRSSGRALRQFIDAHASADNIALFESLRNRLVASNSPADAPLRWEDIVTHPEDRQFIEYALVRVPAFVLTELTEAFQIGFLIFVPFLIIDLVVGNILLAVGMQMMSPTTIALPLKLLLFIMVDGWKLILKGVVLGYT